MRKRGFGLSLRTQLALPCLITLAFPLLGYYWIGFWTETLEREFSISLETSAELIAHSIEQNPEFVHSFLLLDEIAPTRDLSATSTTNTFLLDGRRDDWDAITPVKYTVDNLIEIYFPYTSDSLSFELSLAADDKNLYLFVAVTDDKVIYRQINDFSVHRNDHLRIAVVDKDNTFRRYIIATHQPAEVTAYRISTTGRALRQEPLINGTWRATDAGFNVEFLIPRSLLSDALSMTVVDTDDPESREIKFIMGSAATTDKRHLGTLLLPSRELVSHLRSYPFSHITIVDNHQRIVADSAGAASPQSAERVNDEMISVSYPINLGGKPVAKLIVEESISHIRQLGEQAMGAMTVTYFAVLIILLIVWLLISSNLVSRFRRLAAQANAAVDLQGHVHERMEVSTGGDEISELANTFTSIVNRLGQYNQYLEAMAGRLAHELRTPVSVVRSSLENLQDSELSPENKVYLERAHTGLQRLTSILNKMTEATRLEESLDEDEVEIFNLKKVVEGCISGYEAAYPDNRFELNVEAADIKITGIPDMIAQLMDKLVSNAVEFSESGKPITIRLTIEEDNAIIRVINQGASLPVDSQDDLFNSMVSVRPATDKADHLGLGLYVAKIIADFHDGVITLNNREDVRGVIAKVVIPVMRLSSKLGS